MSNPSTDQLGLPQLGEALKLCFKLFRWLFFVCLIGFLLSGIHTVPQGKVAYVQRWGAWIEDPETPGIHLAYPPFVDKIITFDLQEQRTLELTSFEAPEAGRNSMSDRALLTSDGQLVHTKWVLTYRIADPKQVWNLLGSEYETKLTPLLEKILSSLVISQCSNLNIDDLLRQHQALQSSVNDRFKSELQTLTSGLEVIALNLIGPHVPPTTLESFENAQKQLIFNDNIRKEAEFFANQLYQKIEVAQSQNLGQARAKAQAIVQQLKGEALTIKTLIENYTPETRQAYLDQRLQTALQNAMAQNNEQTFMLQPGGERRVQLGPDPELRRALIRKRKKEAEAQP